MKLQNYLQDGASAQARAIMCMLQNVVSYLVDSHKDKILDEYEYPKISIYQNCRERGYVVYVKNIKNKQFNIAFFENYKSDSIQIIEWVGGSYNKPPDIDTIFDVHKTYEKSVYFSYCQILPCVTHIEKRISNFLLNY
jgi:hypothetical protein